MAFAAIRADGSVVTWGDAMGGGDSSAVSPLLMEGVVQVCGSIAAFVAIKADGSVVTWGDAKCGGDSLAVAPLLTEGVVQVCGSAAALAAIKADGSVVTWGDATPPAAFRGSALASAATGVLPPSAVADASAPSSVNLVGLTAVGATLAAAASTSRRGQKVAEKSGRTAVVARRAETIAATAIANGNFTILVKALQKAALRVIRMRPSGLLFGITNIVGNFGTVFVDQSYWQSAVAANPKSAVKGFLIGGLGVFQVCGTNAAFAAIKADGSVVTWGDASCGGNSLAVAPLLTEGVVQVCGSAKAFAAIKADGSVVTWGDAMGGGDSLAVAPLLTEGVVQVCGSAAAFVAIKADGSVVTWGDAICGTNAAFAAIKADGSVVTWGDASCGGNSLAVAPLLTEGVVQVCGSAKAFAAIQADGSVVTWGDVMGGGDSSPVAPLLTEGVIQVCGNYAACAAIKADGSVVTWGDASCAAQHFCLF
ncbi:unnamed protein product [Polarella glacialis]|uniref:Uncharacterized protein n=1 Tax=Polarella glacialis TaxID=89957 RepID=A0A813EQ66_POLGL|nr:unnamed protein product [Polarella glacialis]